MCVKCEVAFQVAENGVYLVEMFLNPPRPYKVWSTDLWKCPICQYEIFHGFGNFPIMEHYEEKFPALLKKIRETTKRVFYNYELSAKKELIT